MRKVPFLFLLTLSISAFGQLNKVSDLGFKHSRVFFKGDSVDVLMLSKEGDENIAKPLFFFCQGSLPIPLIITAGKTTYPTYPFDTRKLCEKFHLVIVGKPGVPLIADIEELYPDLSYIDKSTGIPPIAYSNNNQLGYYVERNLFVVKWLMKEKNVSAGLLVVAGHSQGARIALEMAAESKQVTHLIYAGGNPCGQIMSMVSSTRQRENRNDSATFAENDFRFYEAIVNDTENIDASNGDSFRSIYSFSKSSMNTFHSLKIPVLVCYGSLDTSCPFNDYLRAESIRQGKKNMDFFSYIGLDHNFFGVKETGELDHDDFNWDKVAEDWLNWLEKQ